ncbi:MAG: NUMOD1 domain-containing DNA-binding protein [Candidatus Azobacteroides sp.]|nr:NUMOD1 domain-containing DNA-binding protein [Candidatus Azobacteroides sp.]
MKKSEAIKQAADASMYQYPYQNLSLVDMEGEIRKELPQSKGYLQVSNYGRAKRVRYLVFKNDLPSYWAKERIIKQVVTKRKNRDRKPYLTFSCKIYKKVSKTITARAVYSAFVNPISFYEDKLVVCFKDENSLNVVLSNLYIQTRSDVAKINTQKEIISSPDFNELSPEKQYNMKNHCKKAVCQYAKNCNFLRQFDGLSDAARICGLSISNIATSCHRPTRSIGGFLWRFGKSTEPLSIQDIEIYRYKWKADRSKPVALYSLDGELIASYRSMEETARKTGYSTRLINMAVHGKVKRTRKGIFKLL